MRIKRMSQILFVVCLFALNIQSQDEATVNRLFKDAIEAMGGETYLNIKDITSEGQYFQFNSQGENSPLIRYVDYLTLPDKNRTELGNKKKDLEISVFNLEKNEGWIVEGQKGVREAKPDEKRSFRSFVKHNIDNIFHFRYKNPENKLFYVGPGEGSDLTLELVKLVDPENDETIIYFDRLSKLPAKIEYREINSRGIRVRVVDEFSQWHRIQGVNTPLRQDKYINGRRSSQLFVLKIEFNTSIPDTFFSKPVQPK